MVLFYVLLIISYSFGELIFCILHFRIKWGIIRENYPLALNLYGGVPLAWIGSDLDCSHHRVNYKSRKKRKKIDYGPIATNLSDAELDTHDGILSCSLDIIRYAHLTNSWGFKTVSAFKIHWWGGFNWTKKNISCCCVMNSMLFCFRFVTNLSTPYLNL